ncbi:hypothetical protein GCM10022224_102000 [Nonomuraea antimicrobica]|uniref:Uncharacterized protein n=1 Tax=Nonomuraea antimicrobica TaxID=561173 RepID=A0ABP7ENN6_9ACTN
MRVPQRVAQQLAHHEYRIVNSGGKYPTIMQISAQTLAGNGNAGRRVRQQHHA